MKSLLYVLACLVLFACAGENRAEESGKPLIGVCSKDFKAVKEAGFDYIELNAKTVATASEPDFEKLIKSAKEEGITVRSVNGFLPGDIRVTGPVIDQQKQMAYVEKCFGRLHKLGVKIVVFGSGGARKIPEGFPRDEAMKQMIDFCRRIGPLAKTNGITVVIEPLNSKECNFISTAKEGLDLVEEVKDSNIELLVDIYHMFRDNESPDIILKAGPHLKHVHISDPKGRTYPLSAEEYDYVPFFENLRKIGYAGGLSIEAGTKDFKTDGPKSVAFLRGMLQAK